MAQIYTMMDSKASSGAISLPDRSGAALSALPSEQNPGQPSPPLEVPQEPQQPQPAPEKA